MTRIPACKVDGICAGHTHWVAYTRYTPEQLEEFVKQQRLWYRIKQLFL